MYVRKANITDKSQIQSLDEELNLYRKKIFSSSTQEFHERINPYEPIIDKDFIDSCIFIAVEEDDTIVGFIRGSITERGNHKLNKLGYIDELFVREEARGKGAAKNLFQKLESEFKRQGCDHMTTHTDFENELSQGFYLQAGMYKTTVEIWKKL